MHNISYSWGNVLVWNKPQLPEIRPCSMQHAACAVLQDAECMRVELEAGWDAQSVLRGKGHLSLIAIKTPLLQIPPSLVVLREAFIKVSYTNRSPTRTGHSHQQVTYINRSPALTGHPLQQVAYINKSPAPTPNIHQQVTYSNRSPARTGHLHEQILCYWATELLLPFLL